MSEVKNIPVQVYAESTPNPYTMKFVCNKPLVKLSNNTYEFNGKEDSKNSPLAKELFTFPFVKSVFISSNFVTVAKYDNVPWDMITLELREFVRDFLSKGNEALHEEAILADHKSKKEENSGASVTGNLIANHKKPKNEEESRIIEILEEYVRPAVEQDGGAIFFNSFDNGVVTLSLQGSCSGCPSSTITLKNGIENLLKKMVPEVKEVVALEA
jgi:NFU1 iron-sulfur cluster scaffold homolog, mitochondrial